MSIGQGLGRVLILHLLAESSPLFPSRMGSQQAPFDGFEVTLRNIQLISGVDAFFRPPGFEIDGEEIVLDLRRDIFLIVIVEGLLGKIINPIGFFINAAPFGGVFTEPGDEEGDQAMQRWEFPGK